MHYLLFGLGAAKQKETAAAQQILISPLSVLDLKPAPTRFEKKNPPRFFGELEVYTGSSLPWES